MAVGVYVHVLCTCRWHPVRPPFHLHPYSLLHTSSPIIFSSATSRSLSLSLSLFLFLLSSLLINKLDYWFRKPTGKRIDRDTGRKTEWRQRDRERETPTPLTFSGSLCMHKSSSERQINSSIGLRTHCNLKNNQRSMTYYMVYVSLVSTPERYHEHKGRQETRYNSTLQWTTIFSSRQSLGYNDETYNIYLYISNLFILFRLLGFENKSKT
jgi:hypothetical protein